MKYFSVIFLFLLGCATSNPNDPALYLTATSNATDLIVIETKNGDQVVDTMQRFLIPKLYKEVPGESLGDACQYQYLKSGVVPQRDLGKCEQIVRPTCFQLLETIRKSIWSKEEVEMATRICAGRSRIANGILLEVVYGENKKWSGSNMSVNAQKEFAALKQRLSDIVGSPKVQLVRKQTATQL